MRRLIFGGIVALALWLPVVPSVAVEQVIMRRGNFAHDFEFIDRFLRNTWPHSYDAVEGVETLTHDEVFVGRYDVNGDGRDELFVYAQVSCGTVGCPTYVFEKTDSNWVSVDGFSDVSVLGDVTISGKRVIVMDVWIDRATGYTNVFSEYAGFRWTGEVYEYLGDNEVVEVSARVPPTLGAAGGCVEPRGERFKYLIEYVDTGRHLCLMYDPNVLPRLEVLLGPKFLHLRKNLERHPGVGFHEGNVFVEGERRETLRDWDEAAMLTVNIHTGKVRVGILTRGGRTIYARDNEWSYLPTLLRAWARGDIDPFDTEQPPHIIWTGGSGDEQE